ncbi:MAG: UDP-2,3-diacylglucosamine diphosphatase LpxI [Magnetococcales bacterium]|nr:UDP-2,3-diacylglucosamine diphosphatase LpxI [Magnetococcales bacterium]
MVRGVFVVRRDPKSTPKIKLELNVLNINASTKTTNTQDAVGAMPPVGSRIGLIAGSGNLPLVFARAVLEQSNANGKSGQYQLFIAAHEDEASKDLEQYGEDLKWVKLGQFKKIIRYMLQKKVDWIAFAGGITKTKIWKIRPDSLALSIAFSLGSLHDDQLLRAVAGKLEEHGFTIGSVTDFVPELLIPNGALSLGAPDTQQWKDICFGWKAAKELGRLDIGQGVVVKGGVVVSVEAMEGTDAMINRTGPLIKGSNTGWANKGSAVLVKTAKPQQDNRLDLPTIGPRTIENLHKAGIGVLAVEANATMILEPEATVHLADKYNIILIGCLEKDIQQVEKI